MSDVLNQSLSQVCRRIKSGELTAEAVTAAQLQRIREQDGELRSYVQVLEDAALAQARDLDRAQADGQPLGLLHGVPIAIKDLVYTRGVPTASGTQVMKDFVPDIDATVLTRLQEAGAVIVGKTQLTEGAFGSHHPQVAPPVNPWSAEHWTGVSSSGSGVAVAAGLAYGALGSDTGGSIRFPSTCCGLVGLKPTYGRVSRHGVFELAGSLDHIGPMARSVEDVGRLLQVMAGLDPADPTTLDSSASEFAFAQSSSLDGVRIGVDWDYVSTGVDPAVERLVRKALDVLQSAGARVVEVTLPPSYSTLVAGWGATCSRECARAHRDYYPARQSEYGPILASLIELGHTISDADYDGLEVVRAQFTHALDHLFDDMDVLIAPCMPVFAPTVAAMEDPVSSQQGVAEFITFTAPFNYSGHPSLTLPLGLDAGLPQAFQLIGAHRGEAELLRIGQAFETARGPFSYPIR